MAKRGRPPNQKREEPTVAVVTKAKKSSPLKKNSGEVVPSSTFSHLPSSVEGLNKLFGERKIVTAREAQYRVLPRIPFGVFDLDRDIGGGVPRGRMTHIRGPFSAGKTTLAYLLAAETQKRCTYCSQLLPEGCSCGARKPGMVALIDTERTHDPGRSLALGVNEDLFLVCEPDTAEQAVDMIDVLVRSGEISLIILDSVADMASEEELTKSLTGDKKVSPALLARTMGPGTKKWATGLGIRIPHPVQTTMLELKDEKPKRIPLPWKNLTTILLLNQFRSSIGPFAAPPPGGHGMMHNVSVGIQLTVGAFGWQGGKEKEDKQKSAADNDGKFATTQTVQYFIEKNKTARGKIYGSFRLDLVNQGVDNKHAYFRYAVNNQIIEAQGSWFSFGGKKIQGKETAMMEFTSDPQIFSALKSQVEVHAFQNGIGKSRQPELLEEAPPEEENVEAAS